MRIALVSCSKSKQAIPCKAAEMYKPSRLFSLSYEYASKNADRIYILSSKYGLLDPDQTIEPYELSMTELTGSQRQAWSSKILSELKKRTDIERDHFIILAGIDYYGGIISHLNQYSLPLGRMKMEDRIAWLGKAPDGPVATHPSGKAPVPTESPTSKICRELHHLFLGERHYHGSEIREIPFENGIYIVYEKGELYEGMPRIVRVGTHTSQGRLKARLLNHFLNENKDGSIFRKNIGKAILNQRRDPFLQDWSRDTSRGIYPQIDQSKQRSVEREVTEYLNSNMDVVVFPVDDPVRRMRLEEGIIASLNQTAGFGPSQGWLGDHSPEREIRNSGLWLKEGLNGIPLRQNELNFIKICVHHSHAWETQSPVDWVAGHQGKPERQSKNSGKASPGAADIKNHIQGIFRRSEEQGMKSCVIRSGDVHKSMGLINRMPMVCSAMYRLMRPGDQIIATTPSGFSSTIQIEYQLSQDR